MLNLAGLKTPGVYVDEVPLFPPSVAQVPTAIPVFIGYTEKAQRDSADLTNVPTKIKSLREFTDLFGEAPLQEMDMGVEVILADSGDPIGYKLNVIGQPEAKFMMHYALQMFYSNGGGDAYIISVGNTQGNIASGSLASGIEAATKVDEITLFVLPDAAHNSISASSYGTLIGKCLTQCQNLGDRFTIIDVPTFPTEFRSTLSVSEIDYLKYGAAYYPKLESNLSFHVFDANGGSLVRIATYARRKASSSTPESSDAAIILAVKTAYATFNANKIGLKNATETHSSKQKELDTAAELKSLIDTLATFNNLDLLEAEIKAFFGENPKPTAIETALNDAAKTVASIKTAGTTTLTDATTAFGATKTAFDTATTDYGTAKTALDAAVTTATNANEFTGVTIDKIKTKNNALFNLLKAKAEEQHVIVPPSGAIAGIYARVDNVRGVWKAPANVGLSAVVRPMVTITDKDQEELNVDVNAGKSINAIRQFTGKGTLVWGARTLAGNDNEWRYVSVRRFFNMVEESVKKASERFVFEPNDANTWVKVQAMIENFLTLQWQAGALAGAKPEQAFYVNVGLNRTMSALDILEGRMIVEIGMAVVRPAEFIVLRFMHKMQES